MNRRARLVVFQVDDRHGAVHFFTRGWLAPFSLLARGERGGNMQAYDEGGDAWPKPGARVVLPGSLPFDRAFQRPDDLPNHWPGGKASALYELALQHDDHGTGRGFLEAFARSARVDVPTAALDGLGVVTRRVEG